MKLKKDSTTMLLLRLLIVKVLPWLVLLALCRPLLGSQTEGGEPYEEEPSVSPQEMTEYCFGKTFRPSCNYDEVILVGNASYGIAPGLSCVTSSQELPSCQTNVRDYVSGRCSGRRVCDLPVPDSVMDRVAGCPKQFRSSLTASYSCVKVGAGCERACASNGHVGLTATTIGGYIASIVTSETEEDEACGSTRCPWMIQVDPGQIINLTFYDYTPLTEQQLFTTQLPSLPPPSGQQQRGRGNGGGGGGSGTATEYCRRYALVKERANPKDTPVCGMRQPRQRHVYTSISNNLEVHVTADNLRAGAQFLIKYEAVGCRDLVPPKFSRMRRREGIVDIDCPADGQKWTLTCVGDKWEGEDSLGTCAPEVHAFAPMNPGPPKGSVTAVAAVDGSIAEESNELSFAGFWKTLKSLPFGILLTLVIAIALIIIVLVVTAGIFCIKKRQYDKKHKAAGGIYGQACSEFEFRQDLDGPGTHMIQKGHMMSGKPQRVASGPQDPARDNTYGGSDGGGRWESRPLPSIPRSGTDRSQRSAEYPNQMCPTGSGVRQHYPTNGGCPNGGFPHNGGYPSNGYPVNGGYPGCYPSNGCQAPRGYDPRNPNCQHPVYPSSGTHPNHFAPGVRHPGYPAGVPCQFANHPSYPGPGNNFNSNHPGQFAVGNPNRVTIEMHRPSEPIGHTHEPNRRSAPLGTAAVVFRNGGGPRNGLNTQSGGENTYFVLDADVVNEEPPAEVIDPMSLPRTQNRSTGNIISGPRHSGVSARSGTGGLSVRDSELEPLMTSDGRRVEDVIVDPAVMSESYLRESTPRGPANDSHQPPVTQHPHSPQHQQSMFYSDDPDYSKMNGDFIGRGEESWPPPPMDLTGGVETKFISSGSPPEKLRENGSLEISLRPSRDVQVQLKANGSDVDMSTRNSSHSNNIGSLP